MQHRCPLAVTCIAIAVKTTSPLPIEQNHSLKLSFKHRSVLFILFCHKWRFSTCHWQDPNERVIAKISVFAKNWKRKEKPVNIYTVCFYHAKIGVSVWQLIISQITNKCICDEKYTQCFAFVRSRWDRMEITVKLSVQWMNIKWNSKIEKKEKKKTSVRWC